MAESFLLGVLGGMGPLAAVDFQYKLIQATPAERDQQQLPHVVWNVPQINDRQKALAGSGPSPLPQMQRGIEALNRAGASHIVIACNTAHHWFDALAAVSRAPLLHIADVTVAAIAAQTQRPQRVGLIATGGTLAAGWFQQRLAQLDITTLTPTDDELREDFVPGCYAVKRGALREGGEHLARLADALTARGAQQLVLACTEVPLALAAVSSRHMAVAIDPAQALAQHCAALWQACLEEQRFAH